MTIELTEEEKLQWTHAGEAEVSVNKKKAFGDKKPYFCLIPPIAKVHLAAALQDGANKYGAYDYRRTGVDNMTYISAAQRHLDAYLDGEEQAPDSKVSHLGHVMACMAIVLDCESLGNLEDTRPDAGAFALYLKNLST